MFQTAKGISFIKQKLTATVLSEILLEAEPGPESERLIFADPAEGRANGAGKKAGKGRIDPAAEAKAGAGANRREFGAKARAEAVVGVEVVEAKAKVGAGVEYSIPAFFLKAFSLLMMPPRLELSESVSSSHLSFSSASDNASMGISEGFICRIFGLWIGLCAVLVVLSNWTCSATLSSERTERRRFSGFDETGSVVEIPDAAAAVVAANVVAGVEARTKAEAETGREVIVGAEAGVEAKAEREVVGAEGGVDVEAKAEAEVEVEARAEVIEATAEAEAGTEAKAKPEPEPGPEPEPEPEPESESESESEPEAKGAGEGAGGRQVETKAKDGEAEPEGGSLGSKFDIIKPVVKTVSQIQIF